LLTVGVLSLGLSRLLCCLSSLLSLSSSGILLGLSSFSFSLSFSLGLGLGLSFGSGLLRQSLLLLGLLIGLLLLLDSLLALDLDLLLSGCCIDRTSGSEGAGLSI
jgi:hypothetical protein